VRDVVRLVVRVRLLDAQQAKTRGLPAVFVVPQIIAEFCLKKIVREPERSIIKRIGYISLDKHRQVCTLCKHF